MRSRLHSLLFLAATLFSVGPAKADWPHVRGPAYDGVSAEVGLSDSWPADGPRRLWSRELGQGHSGMIVGDGRLFTQRQSAAGQFLVCLDPAKGQLLWETRYAGPWQLHGAYPGPYASPTFDSGKVYFTSPTGLAGCANAANGSILWTLNVQEHFAGRGYGFGYAATPLVLGDHVILPVGGPNASLVALARDDGRTLWAVGSDPASYCPAFPMRFRDRQCVVGYMENALVIADVADGAILHRQRLSTGYDEHSAWPIYREPHLLLTAPFRAAATRLEFKDGGQGTLDVKEAWSSKFMSNDVASSVLYRDSIFGFDLKQLQSSAHRPSRGTFRCLDWSSGAVRWSTDRVGHATVLAADGLLFLLSDEGELILARADPEKYDELGRMPVFEDEICWSPPALWRGRLFVRSPSRLVCLDVARGGAQPTANVPSPPTPSASIRIDPSWLLTREREFPNDAPSAQEARLWFGVSLLILGVSALCSLALSAAVRQGRHLSPMPWFLAFTMILGLAGPNVLSALADRCLFTWPLSLFAGLHAVVRACVHESKDASRWKARLGIFGLVLLCGLYFVACRMVGMSVGWYYLFGLPFALPVSALAVRNEDRQRPRAAACWVLISFAVFFWAGQALFAWQATRGD